MFHDQLANSVGGLPVLLKPVGKTFSPSMMEEELSYYDIPVIGQRVVFVIDVSKSMAAGGKPNRLERAKKELNALIAKLPQKTLFNIVFYSQKITRWQDSYWAAVRTARAPR